MVVQHLLLHSKPLVTFNARFGFYAVVRDGLYTALEENACLLDSGEKSPPYKFPRESSVRFTNPVYRMTVCVGTYGGV